MERREENSSFLRRRYSPRKIYKIGITRRFVNKSQLRRIKKKDKGAVIPAINAASSSTPCLTK